MFEGQLCATNTLGLQQFEKKGSSARGDARETHGEHSRPAIQDAFMLEGEEVSNLLAQQGGSEVLNVRWAIARF